MKETVSQWQNNRRSISPISSLSKRIWKTAWALTGYLHSTDTLTQLIVPNKSHAKPVLTVFKTRQQWWCWIPISLWNIWKGNLGSRWVEYVRTLMVKDMILKENCTGWPMILRYIDKQRNNLMQLYWIDISFQSAGTQFLNLLSFSFLKNF